MTVRDDETTCDGDEISNYADVPFPSELLIPRSEWDQKFKELEKQHATLFGHKREVIAGGH